MAEKGNHGFLHLSEVVCSFTVHEEPDDGSRLEEVLNLKRKRDVTTEKYRKALLEVWTLSHEDKNLQQLQEKKKQVSSLEQDTKDANESYQKCWAETCSNLKTTLCSMSRVFWFPKNQVQMDSSPLSSTDLHVNLGCSEVAQFSDATVGYIEKHFKPINQAYRVPPLMFFDDECKMERPAQKDGSRAPKKIGKLSYYSEEDLKKMGHPHLTDKNIQDICYTRRGEETVECVVDRLMECHSSIPGGMFVISNFKYQTYLKTLMIILKSKITCQDGDHDIIVIHRRIGVIFIQVKGKTKKSKDVIEMALQQVMKDIFVFYESNRDLDFVLEGRFPVYGFAAVPFLSKNDVESWGICKDHSSKILTECDLKCLDVWLKERVDIPRKEEAFAFTKDQYMRLSGRYVGLLSEVPMRTYSLGNEKLGEKIEKIFLTPDQMALVHENTVRFLCIYGDYGTGKSLVLVEKAKKLVREDESSIAFVISCSDIDNYQLCKLNKPYQSANQLKERFISVTNSMTNSGRLRVMQFGDVLRDVLGDNITDITKITQEMFHSIIVQFVGKQNLAGKCHIFLDELIQKFLLKESSRWDNINLPEGSFCWVSISPNSYRTEGGEQKRIEKYLPRNFQGHHLDRIMRVSQSVCDLVKGIEDHVCAVWDKTSYVGHTFKGFKPLLLTLPKCSCSNSGNILCTCSSERLEASFKRVKERFDFMKLPVIIIMFMFHCGDHLLSLYKRFQEVLQNAFSNCDVKLEWNTMYGSQIENRHEGKTTITIVDQHTFIGCESRNVMCIDMFGMHQWFRHVGSNWFYLIVNRCTAQYIHINWPEVEARSQWLEFLKGYEVYCEEQNIEPRESILDILNTARESQGLCVKALKDKKLFEEIIVTSTMSAQPEG